MAKKAFFTVSEFFFSHRIMFLLAAIASMIIGSPFIKDVLPYRVIPDIFFTLIFICGIYAVSRQKVDIYIALGLATPMFIGIWSSHLYQLPKSLLIGQLFAALFIGFVISRLLKFIFNEQVITKEVIYAAVVVYLLMAMMWTFAYLILEHFYPGSFSIARESSRDTFQYLYFSFVTITTLGFGDIAPLTQKASSLVILEAITGQMYLVVVVAWLVGMQVSGRSRN